MVSHHLLGPDFPLSQWIQDDPTAPLLYLTQQGHTGRYLTDRHLTDEPITDEPQSLTRADVGEAVLARAQQLVQAGLSPGDHVGLIDHTSEALLYWLLACWHQGLVACPLSPRWTLDTRRQLVQQLNLKAAWWADHDDIGLPDDETLITLSMPKQRPRISPLTPQEKEALPSHFEAQQPCVMVLTSGSTGQPKAVRHSFAALRANAEGCRLPYTATDRWLLSLPLYHIGGIAVVVRTLLKGAAWVLPRQRQALLETLQTQPVTHISLVSTQLYRLLQSPTFDASTLTLNTLMLGGGPFAASLLQSARERGFDCWLSYGLSEFAAQVVTAPARNDGSIEIEGSHAALQVRAGELHLRGPAALLGYWDNGQLNSPLDTDGWYATGDLARLEQGRLYLEGRRDNRFISGGEKLQPELIEQALLQHPDIHQAIIVAVADAEYGQRPAAFIDAHWMPHTSPNERLARIRHWLNDRLPRLMHPDHCWPWPEDQTGLKPNRRALQATAQAYLLGGD